MKLLTLTFTLMSFAGMAQAQEFSLRPKNLSYLKPPRADMSPAIFAAHAAFIDFASSVRSIEIPDLEASPQQIVLHGENGTATTFYATRTQRVFEHDITGTSLAAYPEGRLLLHFQLLNPQIDITDNPVLSASIYIVGKYPFAQWGYGDVSTPRLYSDARWLLTNRKLIKTDQDDSHCDPRFPCDPKITYLYEGEFQNSLTGQQIKVTQLLDRKI